MLRTKLTVAAALTEGLRWHHPPPRQKTIKIREEVHCERSDRHEKRSGRKRSLAS